MGPTPKLITIPIDKYKKASPRKIGNEKNLSPKGRIARSRGIPVQLFGNPFQTISNLPSKAFNFSIGSNHNIAYPNPSSSYSTQALSTPHTTSIANHEPSSGALDNDRKYSSIEAPPVLYSQDQAYNSSQVQRGELGSMETLGNSILRDNKGEVLVEASMELKGYRG